MVSNCAKHLILFIIWAVPTGRMLFRMLYVLSGSSEVYFKIYSRVFLERDKYLIYFFCKFFLDEAQNTVYYYSLLLTGLGQIAYPKPSFVLLLLWQAVNWWHYHTNSYYDISGVGATGNNLRTLKIFVELLHILKKFMNLFQQWNYMFILQLLWQAVNWEHHHFNSYMT